MDKPPILVLESQGPSKTMLMVRTNLHTRILMVIIEENGQVEFEIQR